MRWRPKTHTFHLPVGEMTITIEDVGILLGLPTHGSPVCGPTDFEWDKKIEEYLGVPERKSNG
jgi:Plant mobile domain